MKKNAALFVANFSPYDRNVYQQIIRRRICSFFLFHSFLISFLFISRKANHIIFTSTDLLMRFNVLLKIFFFMIRKPESSAKLLWKNEKFSTKHWQKFLQNSYVVIVKRGDLLVLNKFIN